MNDWSRNEWTKTSVMSPGLDIDVLCLLPDGTQRVCYFFDGRYTYSNSMKWGFDVIAWKRLENIKVEDFR
jgi:hypothetical protein